MSLSSPSQIPMTVCQTCGVEGYSNLLIHCLHCQIIAVHRYCVDGPSNVDDDEVIWSCEECVPRNVNPSPGCRKSERVHSKVERESHRRKARKVWRYNWNPSKIEESNLVDQRENEVIGDDSDEKLCEIIKRKQRRMKENGSGSKNRGSGPNSPVTKAKKVLDIDGAIEKSLETEKNLCRQLSEKPDHSKETNSKANESCDGDSVEYTTSENSKDTKSNSGCSQKGDKQSRFNVYEIQTANKKRRLVIAMEYSDSDEEPICVKAKSLHTSSCEPPLKMCDLGLGQQLSLNSKSVVCTQPCLIRSDSLIPTRVSSLDPENCVIPQSSPVLVVNYVPTQPIDTVWRGRCSISRNVRPISFALEARLSNKAHLKVHGAASALPDLLSFEIMEKQYSWPENFEISPPTGDAIGLFFFPLDESSEKWYDSILDEMIDYDLALKCRINNLELLVFCSTLLPEEDRRYRSKYYLWGVFKPRQEATMVRSGKPGTGISDTMYNNNSLSSASPSRVDHCSVMNSSKSHVPRYSKNLVVESPPSITLKNPIPASKDQGYISQTESNDKRSPATSNDNRNFQKTLNVRGSREVKSLYPNSDERENDTRCKKPTNNCKPSSNRKGSDSRRPCKSGMY